MKRKWVGNRKGEIDMLETNKICLSNIYLKLFLELIVVVVCIPAEERFGSGVYLAS